MSALGGWLIIVGIASLGYWLGRREGRKQGWKVGHLAGVMQLRDALTDDYRKRRWKTMKSMGLTSDLPPPDKDSAVS